MSRKRHRQQNKARYIEIPRQTLHKGTQFPSLLQATIRPIELANDLVFSPFQMRRRAPGTYYYRNGCMLIPPPKPMGRFLGFEIKDNEQQMQFFHGKGGISQPTKKPSLTGRRDRTTRVTIELDKPQMIDYIFSPYDGSPFQIVANNRLFLPRKTIIENYYERPKGSKIINKFIYTHDQVYHDANAVLRRYDLLFAIDTNKLDHKEGATIYVSAVREAAVEQLVQGQFICKSRPYCVTHAVDIKEKPEVEAWCNFIEYILNASSEIVRKKIGIIVDSELDHIEGLNLRQTHLAPGFHLPEGLEFIHATDASGLDRFAVNRLIADCDRQATEYKRTLKATPLAQLVVTQRILKEF